MMLILYVFQNLVQYSQFISVIGMHPFIGIVDFISSKDFITIFTSANDKYDET